MKLTSESAVAMVNRLTAELLQERRARYLNNEQGNIMLHGRELEFTTWDLLELCKVFEH